jgi:hypothetical protein
MIDIEHIDEKTHEGDEQGKMYQGRRYFNCPRNVEFLDAIGKECTSTRRLVWTASWWLSESDIPTYPLLQ